LTCYNYKFTQLKHHQSLDQDHTVHESSNFDVLNSNEASKLKYGLSNLAPNVIDELTA
jgi:hypothetical protein